ncbi:hypothetical protein SNEBB_008281 [Seison nebaliae]|nr:hypothetical protein SNEBB_008281 [Seison nebaliae]
MIDVPYECEGHWFRTYFSPEYYDETCTDNVVSDYLTTLCWLTYGINLIFWYCLWCLVWKYKYIFEHNETEPPQIIPQRRRKSQRKFTDSTTCTTPSIFRQSHNRSSNNSLNICMASSFEKCCVEKLKSSFVTC